MIEKRGNRFRVRVAGRHSKSFPKWGEAAEYEATLKRSIARERAGMEAVKDAVTYGQLCELWEANFTPSQWRLDMLKRSKERWGKLFVRSIEPEAVGQWLHGLPLSEKTKGHVLESMRQVFRAGVDWGYLTRSPVRPGSFKAPSKNSRMTPIAPFESWADVVRVADACDTIDSSGPLVRFVAATGLTSPSEWRTARWSDVDRERREMVVHGTKTANRARTIPLSSVALAALDSLPSPIRQDQAIFQVDYPNWRRGTWRLALTLAGQEKRTPNELRHTFAVLALQSGVPIDAVADILGHSDVAITFRYYRKWTVGMAHNARSILDTWTEEDDERGRTRHSNRRNGSED